jgi:hypothetical protein
MIAFYTSLAASFAWALGCLFYDATETQKGIKAGVGVEGNSWITCFYGVKPTLLQCLSIDVPLRTAMAALAFIPSSMYPHVMIGPAVAALSVAGVKNIQGARQWKWCLANPTKTMPVMNTVWQQIIGFWG